MNRLGSLWPPRPLFYRRFVERAVREQPHPDTPLRAGIFVIYGIAGVVSTLGWGTMHLGGGALGPASIYYGSTLLITALVLHTLRTGRLRHPSHALALTFLVIASYGTWITGGLVQSNITPFFALIVSSFFLLGKDGYPWALAYLVVPMLFEAGHWSGVQYPQATAARGRTDATFTWVVMAGVIFISGGAYELLREKAIVTISDADRMKQRFMANLSHELRTPIHILRSTHDLLTRSELSPQQSAMVHRGHNQILTLAHLVDDLLDFSRLEREALRLRPEDFCPTAVLATVAEWLGDECARAGLSFAFSTDPSTPAWVRGDPQRVLQIVNNLATNALKFTERGGITLDLGPHGSHGIRLALRDTGPGIPQHERERVFTSFYQVDGSFARRHDGAGLGLFIVSQLTAAMGGTITLDSTVGAGSTFEVRLPLDAPETADHTLAARHQPPAGVLVLVVDDVEDNRELTGDQLEVLGQRVLLAESGARALALWRERSPDLMLMDIQMPEMDGYQVLREMREESARSGHPLPRVVAMTGHCSAEDAAALTAGGFSEAIFKPFGLDNLRALLTPKEGG
ncbi:MAG: response regulator [Deltaproteobacteria bacterium]|nr:response regulator [Deltaproteobacteria bacterium]